MNNKSSIVRIGAVVTSVALVIAFVIYRGSVGQREGDSTGKPAVNTAIPTVDGVAVTHVKPADSAASATERDALMWTSKSGRVVEPDDLEKKVKELQGGDSPVPPAPDTEHP